MAFVIRNVNNNELQLMIDQPTTPNAHFTFSLNVRKDGVPTTRVIPYAEAHSSLDGIPQDEGVLDEPVLPFRAGGTMLSVPMSEIDEIHVPTPVIAAATRTKVNDLVAKLGDADWAKREAATKALQELGGVAKQPLAEALAATSDPEVKMRLEKLIEVLP